MVVEHAYLFLLKLFRKLVHLSAAKAIDYSAFPLMLKKESLNLFKRIVLFAHFQKKVGAVKTCHKDCRVFKAQMAYYVPLNLLGCGGS